MASVEHAPAPTRLATAGRTVGRLGLTLGSRIQEAVRRAPLTGAADVPPSAAAITPAWLTSALCGEVAGAHVTGLAVAGVSSQTTSRASLTLTYDEAGRAAGLPQHVFVKLTATLRQRMFLGLIRCIEGEPRFYRELRPQLELDCPEGYFGAVDDRSWRSVVVIEDIAATRDATFCHATTPVDRAGIESLLSVMATYHGEMWQSPTITGPSAAWLKSPLDHFHNTSAFLNMRKRCAVGVERTASLIPRAVRDDPDGLWDAFVRSMYMCSEGPMTLLHGDPHVGNTYRTGAGAMAFSDWQVCMRGGWGFDYAYAVSTALTVEDRRAWEDELLAFYLERLARAGGQAPEFAVAKRIYTQCLMYPLHTWTTVIGRSAVQPLMQEEDVCRLIIERVSHAIDDLGAIRA
jgi:hypothetical protein